MRQLAWRLFGSKESRFLSIQGTRRIVLLVPTPGRLCGLHATRAIVFHDCGVSRPIDRHLGCQKFH